MRILASRVIAGERWRWEIVPVVVTGCAGLLVFHRATLLSGFDIVQADVGDSRLVVFLLEHWHRVLGLGRGMDVAVDVLPGQGRPRLHGHAVRDWASLYTVFRSVGMDLFQASQRDHGGCCRCWPMCAAYWLLRRVLTTVPGSEASWVPSSSRSPIRSSPSSAHLQLRFDFFQPLALGVIAACASGDAGDASCASLANADEHLCWPGVPGRFHGVLQSRGSSCFSVGLSAVVAASSRAVQNLIVMRLR